MTSSRPSFARDINGSGMIDYHWDENDDPLTVNLLTDDKDSVW